METYEKNNHKNGKIITILIIVLGIGLSVLFGYLYFGEVAKHPLIDYPTYTLSTRDFTSSNVTVTVTNPSEKVSEYSFDGGQSFQIGNTFDIVENGIYSIILKDINGRLSKKVTFRISNIDKVAPTINFENPTTIKVGTNFSLKTGVIVTDKVDDIEGSGLSNGYVVTPDKIDTNVAGTYNVTYTAFDKVGNYTEKTRTIIVTDYIGTTYYRYRTASTENYQCEPYACNCVVTETAKLNQVCPAGYSYNEPDKCCRTCYKTCKKTNWSDWSDWSTNKVNPSVTVEVETKVE